MKILIFLILIVATLTGCAPKNKLQDLYMFKASPRIEVFKNPKFESHKWKTFSIIKVSEYFEKYYVSNDILEMQILYYLRNVLEDRGYKYVEVEYNPDILVTADIINYFDETVVPIQQFIAPKWVPERTITTYENSRGDVRYRGHKIGTFSGSGISTTYIPGYITNEVITLPPQVITSYNPTVGVYLLSPKNFEKLWTGVAVTSSDNPDIRITSQPLLIDIVKNIPLGPSVDKVIDISRAYNIEFGILTANGNEYYPVVNPLNNENTVQNNLSKHDMVLSINNRPVKNITFGELINILIEEYNEDKIYFDIARAGTIERVVINTMPGFDEKFQLYSLSNKAFEISKKWKLDDIKKREDFEQYDNILSEMIRINPQDDDLYLQRGAHRMINKEGDKAMDDFNMAISLTEHGKHYEGRAYNYIFNFNDFNKACIDAHAACELGVCDLLNALKQNNKCK